MLITPSGERVNIFFGTTVQSVISQEIFFLREDRKTQINHRFSTLCAKSSKYSGVYVRALTMVNDCLLDFFFFFCCSLLAKYVFLFFFFFVAASSWQVCPSSLL